MPTTPNNPRLSFEDSVEDGQRQLVMVKNGHRYVFRCAVGREADMLAQLGELIQNHGPDAGEGTLDWFDAALISHQIGQRMSDTANRTLRKAS